MSIVGVVLHGAVDRKVHHRVLFCQQRRGGQRQQSTSPLLKEILPFRIVINGGANFVDLSENSTYDIIATCLRVHHRVLFCQQRRGGQRQQSTSPMPCNGARRRVVVTVQLQRRPQFQWTSWRMPSSPSKLESKTTDRKSTRLNSS